MSVDEVDADLLAALRQAVPATRGNTRRLASLGPLLEGIESRIVDDDGNVLPPDLTRALDCRVAAFARGSAG